MNLELIFQILRLSALKLFLILLILFMKKHKNVRSLRAFFFTFTVRLRYFLNRRTNDDNQIAAVYKDQATAFNGRKQEQIAGKGRLNNLIYALLFEKLHEAGV